MDILLIFVQLGLENFGKTVRDPPFYYLRKSAEVDMKRFCAISVKRAKINRTCHQMLRRYRSERVERPKKQQMEANNKDCKEKYLRLKTRFLKIHLFSLNLRTAYTANLIS